MHKGIFTNGASRHHLSTHYKHLKNALKDSSSDVRDRIQEVLSDSLYDAKIKSKKAKRHISEYVSDQPFKSLGIAVITGLLLGYFFRK